MNRKQKRKGAIIVTIKNIYISGFRECFEQDTLSLYVADNGQWLLFDYDGYLIASHDSNDLHSEFRRFYENACFDSGIDDLATRTSAIIKQFYDGTYDGNICTVCFISNQREARIMDELGWNIILTRDIME